MTARLSSSDWDQIVASLEFSLLAVEQHEEYPSPQFRAERRDQIQRVLTKAHAHSGRRGRQRRGALGERDLGLKDTG